MPSLIVGLKFLKILIIDYYYDYYLWNFWWYHITLLFSLLTIKKLKLFIQLSKYCYYNWNSVDTLIINFICNVLFLLLIIIDYNFVIIFDDVIVMTAINNKYENYSTACSCSDDNGNNTRCVMNLLFIICSCSFPPS